nr:hypothetical protein [Candidatus Electrothrix aestuarii]
MIQKWLLAVTALLLGIVVSIAKPSWSEQLSPVIQEKEAPASQELVIADKGKTTSVIVVTAKAGSNELLAAEDLAKYIEMMSGATPAIANTPKAITAALQGQWFGKFCFRLCKCCRCIQQIFIIEVEFI